jgi:hypothetical protein
MRAPAADDAEAMEPTLPGIDLAPLPESIEDMDDPMPDLAGIEVETTQILLKPVGIKRRKGAIIFSDQTIDDQYWTHGLGRVAKLGPSVYRGKRFADLGLSPEDAPPVGAVVNYNARTPRRVKIDGEVFIIVNDDAIGLRIDPAQAHRITFHI